MKNYNQDQMQDLITDLTLGNEPRHPADTPEKKGTFARLKAQIDQAKKDGRMIIAPE